MAPLGENARFKQISDRDLEYLYRSADIAAFYVGKTTYLTDLERYVHELDARGLAGERHFSSLYGAYIAGRNFDRARKLAATGKVKDTMALPAVIDDLAHPLRAATVYEVSLDSMTLQRVLAPLSLAPTVIVVAHPLCHFSQDAIRDIDAEPGLAKALHGHDRYLVPPERTLNFGVMQQWNREHPRETMTLVYSESDWPMFTSWDTPTFYFFNHGALITMVSGWPAGGNKESIGRALQRIGLLPSENVVVKEE
jgi:hypothetical protein